MLNEELLTHELNRMVNNKTIFGAVMCVENGDKSFSWTGAAGNAMLKMIRSAI